MGCIQGFGLMERRGVLEGMSKPVSGNRGCMIPKEAQVETGRCFEEGLEKLRAGWAAVRGQG